MDKYTKIIAALMGWILILIAILIMIGFVVLAVLSGMGGGG